MPESRLHMMVMPSNMNDHSTWETIARYHLIYSLAGLLLGCICIIGGIILFLHGVVGSTSWTAKIIGAESRVADAAPGAVLFIVGLFIVYVTRFSAKVQKMLKDR
jgi:hypothetical protein